MTEPVVTVFPTEDPDTIPQSAEEITATFAGPPAEEPQRQFARSIKKIRDPRPFQKRPENDEDHNIFCTDIDRRIHNAARRVK